MYSKFRIIKTLTFGKECLTPKTIQKNQQHYKKTLNAPYRRVVAIDSRRRSADCNLAQFIKCIGIAEVLFASVVSALLGNDFASSFQKSLERYIIMTQPRTVAICILITLHFIPFRIIFFRK